MGELAAALAALVRRVQRPTLFVGIAPIVPAFVLAVEGMVLGGVGGRVAVTIAVIGAAPGGWLLLRRYRMVRAVEPVADLARELREAYDLAGVWPSAEDAGRRVRSPGRGGLRGAARAAGGVWAGVRLTRELFDRFSDLPRVQQFTPIRLQTSVYLGAACLVALVVMSVLDVVALVLVLLTS